MLVLRQAGSAVTDAPSDGSSYSVGETVGSAEVACVTGPMLTSCQDVSVNNGTLYHYRAFAMDQSRNYADGIATRSFPRDSSLFKWAVTTAAASLAPPSALPGEFVVSIGDDNLIHRMSESDGRRSGWNPPTVGGAVQSRTMVGDISAGGNDLTAFSASQDGFLYRHSLEDSATLDASVDVVTDAGCPGGFLQGGPVIVLDAYDSNTNADDDVVLVATRCGDTNADGTFNDNKVLLYSHDLQTLFGTYDGDADGTGTAEQPGLGISNATPRILYRDTTNNLIYVPFRNDGDDNESIVVLSVGTGSTLIVPPYSEIKDLGNVDASPVVFRYGTTNDFRLLFGATDPGTGNGTVYLYDAVARTGGESSPLIQKDSFDTNDGPIKGVEISTRVPIGGGLFEYWVVWTTDTLVHGVRIKPGSGTFDNSKYWTANISGPSAPLVLRNVDGNGGVTAYVGSSDGLLYELNAKNGNINRSWSVEPSATVGEPSFDYNDGSNQGIIVGSSSGMIHWIRLN